ncbi:MAG: ChbG/HpnK family deacetylase [Methylacidiphilales bacterium]|nr:ChbG/HpnK family deacetylase [Candidatus Methylacidiphilales bacterium]
MKRIQLVADDYALAPGVSAAIRDLAAAGRLSATSVMTVVPGFRTEAARLRAAAMPQPFGIGLHLTLTGPFQPLTVNFAPTTRSGTFPDLPALMALAFAGRLKPAVIRAEIEAQLDAFAIAFGRMPDHVDGHQHVQLLPTIRRVVLDVVADRLHSAWVRQCAPAAAARNPFRDPKGALIGQLSRTFKARAATRGIRVNPAFAGAYLYQPTADFAALFPRFLDGLPDGGVVMCHPGHVDAELVARDPLTSHREAEYAFLAGDGLPAALAAAEVELQ